jgi:phosphoribosyl 1,2-cyclic phosphodiesterase
MIKLLCVGKLKEQYLRKIIGPKTKNILLAHLSEKNNTEEKALEALNEEIIEENINIGIARQHEESEMIEV